MPLMILRLECYGDLNVSQDLGQSIPGRDGRRGHGKFIRSLGLGSDGECEVEGGATAEFAFNPNTTAMHLDNMFHDGQPKAGAS